MPHAIAQNLPENLTPHQRNALAILSKLDLEDFNDLKELMQLGTPGIIGPQTLADFMALCRRMRLDLSNDGVNAFKEKHQLGNSGSHQGVIGPQTAGVYYQTILVLMDRTAVSPGCFPFSELPDLDWKTAPRSFASNRSRGTRAHAGCDLYFPLGTPIHAITDGTVIQDPYAFYDGTFALEVDHGDFIARYGEIQPNCPLRKGNPVAQGQRIARVGRLESLSFQMLHLELYDKSGGAFGPLTVGRSASKLRSDGKPYFRRKDLIDPTSSLDAWKDTLPG